jgi:hypothetical protein
VLRRIAGCHYRFEIDIYRQLVGLWRLTICGMLSIEIVPLTDTSVREDEVDASYFQYSRLVVMKRIGFAAKGSLV